MAGRGQSDEWPADMERRRLAALEKFQRDHPDYVLPGTSQNRSGGEKRDPAASGKPVPSAKTAGKGKGNHNENRWCLETTLELLEEMKAFVRANKVHCIGEGIEKWLKIVVHLKNPCGLQLRRLARSSMVRFDNLRRNYRTHLRSRMELEVQDSLIDYFLVCKQYKAQGSTTASTKVLSTMHLALDSQRSSPSPPPTPAPKKSCRRQIPVDSEISPHEGEDNTMSSADDSTSDSDDDAVELSGASGSPQPPLTYVDTPITLMLPTPAVETESSDEKSAESSYSGSSSG